MIDVTDYMNRLTDTLKAALGSRLVYVGLQGSYLRGEANEHSDIDIMVVIDSITVKDLQLYRDAIWQMPHFDHSCGFICGREDLINWNPLEICHLLHTTRDHYGVLKELVPAYTKGDLLNYIKMGLNNLYHGICHSYIHAENNKNLADLAMAYKGTFFLLQNLYYYTHGQFIATKAEFITKLRGKDRAVLSRALELQNGTARDFDDSFSLLFTWCKNTLASL
ncbi:MAG: nucleotidyltransferase domain-containing protein [Clostridiales bacterium]|nr:nucleotidyltransferase domain-containing protein [Clostridiales bacterium]